MTALRAHRRGGPEVLVVERAPVPVPAPGEVLLAVHAAAITFDELTWDETWTRDGVARIPVIPSHEVSGVVSEITSGVTDFKPGDEVYGLIRFDRDGAAADFVAVPAADLAAKPATVSHAVAAALPLAGLTALQALVDHAAVRSGEAVLVHGGAGGVGALTVQLAAILGANVTATIRSDAGELLRGFGAERVIDVRTEAFDQSGPAYDLVIDTVGGETLDRSFCVLRRGGRLVTLSAPLPAGRADEYGVTATFFIVTPNRGQLAELAALVDSGRLQVEIAEMFPLGNGRQAFESGRQPGRRAGKTSSSCGTDDEMEVSGSSVMTAVGKIVVAGATGLIGAKVVDFLTANGQRVLPASRRTGIGLLTGDGLTDALRSARVWSTSPIHPHTKTPR